MIDLKSKSNWTNKNIQYLKNILISEYDLRAGGLSVIKENHLLKQEQIDKLSEMDKIKRNIIIGKLQAKSQTLTKEMVEGFGDARAKFANLNNLKEDDILSIKKDALFLINKPSLQTTVSNNLTFVCKNTYSSYINISNKEFYFSILTRQLDVKGISEECKKMQEKFLLNDIAKILAQSEKISKEQIFTNLKKYRSDYLNRKLPIETYRNLETGLFTLEDGYEMDTVDDSFIDQVDIAYNYIYYILPLIKIILNN